MPLPDMKKQCTARSKRTGVRCQNPAVNGYNVCRHHGANPKNRGGRPKGCDNSKSRKGGAPKDNANSVRHGVYSTRLPLEEREIFEQHLEQYLSDVPNPSVTDRRALERLAILETKWQVAVTQGAPADALDVLHRLLHRELKALQVTREGLEHGTNVGHHAGGGDGCAAHESEGARRAGTAPTGGGPDHRRRSGRDGSLPAAGGGLNRAERSSLVA